MGVVQSEHFSLEWFEVSCWIQVLGKSSLPERTEKDKYKLLQGVCYICKRCGEQPRVFSELVNRGGLCRKVEEMLRYLRLHIFKIYCASVVQEWTSDCVWVGSWELESKTQLWALVSSLVIGVGGPSAFLCGAVQFTVCDRPGVWNNSIPVIMTPASPRSTCPLGVLPTSVGPFGCWLSVSLWYSPRVGKKSYLYWLEWMITSFVYFRMAFMREGKLIERRYRLDITVARAHCILFLSPTSSSAFKIRPPTIYHSCRTELWWYSLRQKHSAWFLQCAQCIF